MSNERYVCTKDAPWSAEKGDWAQHPDAKWIDECSDSCCNYYRCPNCGLTFKVEVGR